MEMALSQFSFIMHSQTLECISMHSQCILKHWPCYLMEPNKVENHSEAFGKRLQMFAKCFNVSLHCLSRFCVRGHILTFKARKQDEVCSFLIVEWW